MIQNHTSISAEMSLYVREASRKFIFNSYRLFREFLATLNLSDVSIEKMLLSSENFRIVLNNFIQDLLLIEENVENNTILGTKIDTILEFTRLSHLIEIMFLNNQNEHFLYIIKWLQNVSNQKSIPSPLDTEESSLKFFTNIHPESSFEGYWDLIYSNILQGKLLDASSLLLAHSEISKCNSAEKNMILSAFNTHPLIIILAEDSLSSLDISSIVTSIRHGDLMGIWHRNLEELAGSRLIRTIPELLRVVELLMGHEETTHTIVESNWTLLLLSKILYKSTITFSVVDIINLIDHMDMNENISVVMFKEILEGHLGLFVKTFYEKFFYNHDFSSYFCELNSSDSQNSILELNYTFQIALVNLVQILEPTGALSYDSDFPIYDSTFVEELTLCALENLNQYNFPFEVITSYLSTCPVNGKEFARTFLLKRPLSSDKETLSISSALRAIGCESDARVVEVARGKWWLQYHKSSVKAVYFFLKAKDMSKIISLCETTVFKVIHAVQRDFDGLNIKLSPKFPPYMTVNSSEYYQRNLTGYTLAESIKEATDILGCMGIDSFEYNSMEIMQMSQFICKEAYFLYCYVRIIINFKSIPLPNDLGSEKYKSIVSNFLDSSNCLSILLSRKVAPLRFWLHLLELSVWLQNKYEININTINNNIDIDQNIDFVVPKSIFSKIDAYMLMVSLDRLATSFVSDELCSDISQSDIISVRLKLVNLWSLALIQSNAENYQKQEDTENEKLEYNKSKTNFRESNTLKLPRAIDLITSI